MDFSQLQQLGVAGVSIGTLGYICFRLIVELKESRVNYTNFVQDNNHTTTELVREATATMVVVKNAIETHNEVLKRMVDKLD